MRLGLVAGSPIEWLAVRLNLVPRPLMDTQVAFTLAQVIMVASKIGLFDALASGPATAEQLARQCATNPAATEKLLPSLVASGYLRARAGRYELTGLSRKWLVSSSPRSLADKLALQFQEWTLLEGSEAFVRSGTPVDVHDTLSDDEWGLYQRGMKALSGSLTGPLAKAVPIPAGATDLLDIGGSHGAYAVALCRRHPGLRAVVLDLPEAVRHAAGLLAAQGMGERVRHREGDALADDLGERCYDAVTIIGVVHHFTDEQNRALAAKVARALRPGGTYTIADFFRLDDPGRADQVPALMDFYFALTSRSGTWPPDRMADWQREAGLAPAKPVRLAASGGVGLQSATKPR
ncbi:class I SAM-dependent methyltransferase [Pseudonocardia acaciae]|uniref:class I SAM-dependent methyltransferase n=1 Tax=Pseudonocardia acaciae TaxID=551276 RepID=UPI00056367BF|nr:class I SAM-dependent methyltransferase [Pseudonocardia acaciae]